jgi:hypothetical protein
MAFRSRATCLSVAPTVSYGGGLNRNRHAFTWKLSFCALNANFHRLLAGAFFSRDLRSDAKIVKRSLPCG